MWVKCGAQTGLTTVMGIRVLLDHGLQECNIIFLAFLISRQGVRSVKRAFPGVRVVTAAIDSELHEMHFPLSNEVMGEAAGEADFIVRRVDGQLHQEPEVQESEQADGLDHHQPEPIIKTESDVDHFKIPVRQDTEDLKFSRAHHVAETPGKRAWVISPGEYALPTHPHLLTQGMGHIGDRYYSS